MSKILTIAAAALLMSMVPSGAFAFGRPYRPHPPICDEKCQEQQRLNKLHPAPAPTSGNPNVSPPAGAPKHQAL